MKLSSIAFAAVLVRSAAEVQEEGSPARRALRRTLRADPAALDAFSISMQEPATTDETITTSGSRDVAGDEDVEKEDVTSALVATSIVPVDAVCKAKNAKKGLVEYLWWVVTGRETIIPSACGPKLNEIRVQEPGTDNSCTSCEDREEFFELKGKPFAKLEDLWILVIGDDGDGNQGVVESAIDLSGYRFSANGLFVVAKETFTLGKPDLVASFDIRNDESINFFLVKGFYGSVGQDLDIDDNGNLDIQPWHEVVDCLAMWSTTSSFDDEDRIYCSTRIGPDYDRAWDPEDDFPANREYTPYYVYRCKGDWFMGNKRPGTFPGKDSPGKPNNCVAPGSN